jgi:MFS family permease
VPDRDLPPSLRAAGSSAYPLAALGALAAVDVFAIYAFTVLAPDIAGDLGMSRTAVVAAVAVRTLVVALAGLPLAHVVRRRPVRARVALTAGAVWSALTVGLAFVGDPAALVAALLLSGASVASVAATHQPLLLDLYPPGLRMRVLSRYRAADQAGNVVAPLVVAGVVVAAGRSWRDAFAVLGVLSVLAVVAASRLRDPGLGRFDGPHQDPEPLGLVPAVRRLWVITTFRRLLAGLALVGVFSVPFATYLTFFLEEVHGLGALQRAGFFALMAACSAAAVLASGRPGEVAFARSPGDLLRRSSEALAMATAVVALAALVPEVAAFTLLLAVAFALLGVVVPGLTLAALSLVGARLRPHVAALLGTAVAGVGGLSGTAFLAAVDRRYGVTATMVALALPGCAGAVLVRRAAGSLETDLPAADRAPGHPPAQRPTPRSRR